MHVLSYCCQYMNNSLVQNTLKLLTPMSKTCSDVLNLVLEIGNATKFYDNTLMLQQVFKVIKTIQMIKMVIVAIISFCVMITKTAS